uniref:Uncharacterized protein n=1 Tax=Nelumbo nucifera TaxID=4432 RepID=A0A822XZB3_NELNU|nr:TPA_asm: hypothetical protein HUJ06_025873 [Nelumbo nucifera]
MLNNTCLFLYVNRKNNSKAHYMANLARNQNSFYLVYKLPSTLAKRVIFGGASLVSLV